MSGAESGRRGARNGGTAMAGTKVTAIQTIRWGGLGLLALLAVAALVYFTIVAPTIVIVQGNGTLGSIPMFLLTAAVAVVVAFYVAPRGWRYLRASRDAYMQEELMGEMRPRMREFRYSLHMMRKSTLAMIGLGIVVFFILVAILGPFLAPYPAYGTSFTEHHVAPGQGAVDVQGANAATANSTTWANKSFALKAADGKYASSSTVGDTLILGGFGPALHFLPATVTALEVGVKYKSIYAQDLSLGDIPSLAVSWDGGTTWSASQVAPLKVQDDGNYWYLSFTNAHTWDAEQVNQSGVQVRVTHVAGTSGNAVLYVDAVQVRATFLGPVHILGTNEYGQDVLSGLMLGTGVDMRIGVLVVFGAVAIGILLGVFSGYLGRGFDEAIMRITDMFLAVPGLILALAFAAVLGRSLDNILIALMLVSWPGYTRLIRGQVLSAREVSYVEAARAVGAPTRRIVMRHILPNVIAPVIVAATLDLGTIVISTAALSFIGLGAQPVDPEWGVMISRGYRYMISGYWWEFVPPGVAILLFVLAFNLFGDGIRDILDPRLRR